MRRCSRERNKSPDSLPRKARWFTRRIEFAYTLRMNASIPEQLVRAVAEGRLVPFVGSGVSLGFEGGLPTWPGLLSKLSQVLRGGVKADIHAANVVEGFVQLKRYSNAAEEVLKGLGKHRFHEEIANSCDTRITGNLRDSRHARGMFHVMSPQRKLSRAMRLKWLWNFFSYGSAR